MKIDVPNFLLSALLLTVLILNFADNGIGRVDTYEIIKMVLVLTGLIITISLFIKKTWFNKDS